MLDQPITVVTPALRMVSQIKGMMQGVGRCTALGNGRKIENGKWNQGILLKYN